MSKKSKSKRRQKQLISAQIKASQQAVLAGREAGSASVAPASATSTNSTRPIQSTVAGGKIESGDELAIIKKDTLWSLLIFVSVLIIFAIIYYLDQQYNFFIALGNYFFDLVR